MRVRLLPETLFQVYDCAAAPRVRLGLDADVSALRPYARNLMVTEDEDDVAAVLTALRA